MKNYVIEWNGMYFRSWAYLNSPLFTDKVENAYKGDSMEMLEISTEILQLGIKPLKCVSLDTISTTGSIKEVKE